MRARQQSRGVAQKEIDKMGASEWLRRAIEGFEADPTLTQADGFKLGDEVVPRYHRYREYKKAIYAPAVIVAFLQPSKMTDRTVGAMMQHPDGSFWVEHCQYIKHAHCICKHQPAHYPTIGHCATCPMRSGK